VKRRAAVKLMQMPWNPNAAQETAPKWSESLSHSLVLASSKWLFNVVTCGRYELMCREQSFPFSFHFPTWSHWLPCTHGSGFWLGPMAGMSFLFCRLLFWLPLPRSIHLSSLLPTQRNQWNNFCSFRAFSLPSAGAPTKEFLFINTIYDFFSGFSRVLYVMK